eukprot:363609-Chlamydomonas_euryale.AAC.12
MATLRRCRRPLHRCRCRCRRRVARRQSRGGSRQRRLRAADGLPAAAAGAAGAALGHPRPAARACWCRSRCSRARWACAAGGKEGGGKVL